MKYILLLLLSTQLFSNELYFPESNELWERLNPQDIDWNLQEIDSLDFFLKETDTKAFIILKDGKIVIENYYDGFTADSFWYWASAGKTVTACLVGIAQEEGLLNIHDKTDSYLGEGWTNCLENESDISIWNQLSMTTGLDYNVDDIHCILPECLLCLNEASSEWYYHNAPYTLLANVVESASGETYNQFYRTRLANKLDMGGAFYPNEDGNLLITKPLSMARFGLMILAGGFWKDERIVPEQYYNEMISTSQDINKSYGYLWWLNGKESHRLPGSTFTFDGPLVPSAPSDMFAGLGKNDQKVYVVPSENLVVVRMGDDGSDSRLALSSYDTKLWEKISNVIKTSSKVEEIKVNYSIENNILISENNFKFVRLIDITGRLINTYTNTNHITLPSSKFILIEIIDSNKNHQIIKYFQL